MRSKNWWILTTILALMWCVVIAAAIRAWVVWDELVLADQDEFVLAWVCAHALLTMFGTWVWSWELRNKRT
jgi:hypothetical protein